jgi:hypothetical protein
MMDERDEMYPTPMIWFDNDFWLVGLGRVLTFPKKKGVEKWEVAGKGKLKTDWSPFPSLTMIITIRLSTIICLQHSNNIPEGCGQFVSYHSRIEPIPMTRDAWMMDRLWEKVISCIFVGVVPPLRTRNDWTTATVRIFRESSMIQNPTFFYLGNLHIEYEPMVSKDLVHPRVSTSKFRDQKVRIQMIPFLTYSGNQGFRFESRLQNLWLHLSRHACEDPGPGIHPASLDSNGKNQMASLSLQ